MRESLQTEMQLQYNDQKKDSGVIAEKSLKAHIRMSHSYSKEGIKSLWITPTVTAETSKTKNSTVF